MITICQLRNRTSILRRDLNISPFDLPYHFGLKPHIRFKLLDKILLQRRFDPVLFEFIVESFKDLI
jgi:hypothetical protein